MVTEEQAIKELSEKLLELDEKSEEKDLDQVFVSEPRLYCSMLGKGYDLQTLHGRLARTYQPVREKDLAFENYCCLIKKDRAYLYGTVRGTFTGQDQSCIHWGGILTAQLTKREEGWRFFQVRFDLRTDDGIASEHLTQDGRIVTEKGQGNRQLLSGWNLVNDRVGLFMGTVDGQGTNVITGELDAPWYVAGPQSDRSDAGQINSLFCRLCCGIDLDAFGLVKDCLTDDAQIMIGTKAQINAEIQPIAETQSGAETQPGVETRPGARLLTARQGLAFLKLTRQGSPRSFHSGPIQHLVIDGDRASFSSFMGQPEDRTWQFHLIRTQQGWKIDRLERG